MVILNNIEFREALETYFIQKGVNIKLKPNEKERVNAHCTKKDCPWHILGCIDGNTGIFSVKTYFPVHKCFKRTRNKHVPPFGLVNTTKRGL